MSLDQIFMLPPSYGFDAPGFNPSSLGNLLAEYDFLQGANPLVLYDKSANAAHGTVVSGVTWSSYGLTTASGSKWATTAVNAQTAKTILLYFKPATSGNPSPFANGGSVSALTPLYAELVGTLAYGDIYARMRDLNTGANTAARHNVSQWPYCLGYTLGTPCKQYANGVEASIYEAQSNVGNYAPNSDNIRLSNNFVNTGSSALLYCYALFFSDAKSASDVLRCYNYMKAKVDARSVPAGGPASLTNNYLIFTGNSITVGLTPSSITTSVTFDKMIQGLGGASLSQWVTFAGQTVTPTFRPLATRNYAVIWPTAMVTTTAQVDSTVVPYAALLRSAGWKVAVATSISSTTGDSAKNTVNAYYDTLMAGGTPPFDTLIDLRSITEVSADGAYANTTYFLEGLHLTAAAYALVNPAFGTGVDALG